MPKKSPVASISLPKLMTVSPAPCRMIKIYVYRYDEAGSFGVQWAEVIGVLCVAESDYSKRWDGKAYPAKGRSDAEMDERGWTYQSTDYSVWPIVIGNMEQYDSPLRIETPRDDADNLVYSAIVRCDWAESKDRDEAQRIAIELIKNKGNRKNWIDIKIEPGSNGEKH
jgi:hypothetical protein